jgi:hypothetical protein
MEAASRKLPEYSGKVPAVTLADEERMVVDLSGRVTVFYRHAIKVLTRDGRERASAAISYLNKSSKVRNLEAWLITPSDFVKEYGKESVVDIGSFGDELYDEYRAKVVSATLPEIGSVFGYEGEVEERTVFSQESFSFQGRLPSLVSRLVLELPAGWTATAVTFNHAPVAPVVQGSTYTWELRDLPFLEDEDGGPDTRSIAPRVSVTFYGPGGAAVSGDSPSLKTWQDVSTWLTQLSAGQDEPSPDLSAKAKELTVGAMTEYAKVQAIGTYVQKLKYVSIQTGLARGGGYRPHTADMVFRKQYGDCKDKANLMRAMLRALGIPAYLVSIYSGDRDAVREEWPSPMQFNHAIVAVNVSGETKAATVIEKTPLGRLLIFDPTDEHTPVGDLPFYEQGSFALVEAGERGALLRMPIGPPESNIETIEVRGTLAADGSLKATFSSEALGQEAAETRRQFAHEQPSEYIKDTERWFSRSAKSVVVEKVEPADRFGQDQFDLKVAFAAPSYAQVMLGGMMLFRPSVVYARGLSYWTGEKRTTPLVLEAKSFKKKVTIQFPVSFQPDEVPEGGSLKTPFGSYHCAFKVDGNSLVFEEELKVDPVTVPLAEYGPVKKFFQQVWGAEQAPVVLVKKTS